MKILSLLGCTGSIGENVLSLVDLYPDQFRIGVLAAGSNIQKLLLQVQKYRPELVAVRDIASARELRSQLPGIKILEGEEGIIRAAADNLCDIVVAAISGFAGLKPVYAALKAGKCVALANKESLIAAGEAMTSILGDNGGKIIPVDSEHSALHQCLKGSHSPREVSRLILTASGGPFLTLPIESLHDVSVKEALAHPTWKMGPKITIDSATMMNKGLEVIEAHHLFGVSGQDIAVIIQPQSLIHSMVEFIDGTILAQMSLPDMRVALLYAFSYPERWKSRLPKLDLFSLPSLDFVRPDLNRFPCLDLAYQALGAGATFPAALNAANETAVSAFLSERIHFTRIYEIVETVLQKHEALSGADLESVFQADQQARALAEECIKNHD
jgi:1-deoxy-D-xylulose-5-phosphate reductoisomerase